MFYIDFAILKKQYSTNQTEHLIPTPPNLQRGHHPRGKTPFNSLHLVSTSCLVVQVNQHWIQSL